MNPHDYPDNFDELIERWSREYGATGVKLYELEMHPQNRGCVAVYREMSLQDRALLARLEEIDEESPGAYDYMRSIASACLLYPTLDAYPHPAMAAAELFQRMRQHGHGALHEGEDLLGSEETGYVPEHMASDVRNARRIAAKIFSDPRYGSVYRDIIMEMTIREGQVDVQLLDYLWRLSPGRIRDLGARLEQIHILLRTAAASRLSQVKNEKERRARAEQIEAIYGSPFEALDKATGGETVPDMGEASDPPDTQNAEPVDHETLKLMQQFAGLEDELEQALEHSADYSADYSDDLPPNR